MPVCVWVSLLRDSTVANLLKLKTLLLWIHLNIQEEKQLRHLDVLNQQNDSDFLFLFQVKQNSGTSRHVKKAREPRWNKAFLS